LDTIPLQLEHQETIGLLRTHGVLLGDKMVTFGLRNQLQLEKEFVVLPKNQLTQQFEILDNFIDILRKL